MLTPDELRREEEALVHDACRLCKHPLIITQGTDDTFPHLCDDCWARVSMEPEAVTFRAKPKDSQKGRR